MDSERSTDHRSGQHLVPVILAAGAGTRFSGSAHKLNAMLDGDTVAGRAIRNAVEADVGQVVIVTGATPLDALRTDVVELTNRDWELGQATSLAVAIEYARAQGADAIVIGLADQPFITPEAWRRVAASRADIAVATYGGGRGHPVRFAATVWDRLPTTGDVGARDVIRLHQGSVETIPCTGSAVDIDTVEDLEQWQNNSSTSSPSTGQSTKPGR